MPHPDFNPAEFLKTCTTKPGVYIMQDEAQRVLYVGKAKNLQNRLASYFRNRGLNGKTQALVGRIHSIELTVTPSETEALLLEHSLIKKHRPPYNILLIDGKSYPYLLVSTHHSAPGIFMHRGAKKQPGRYFGPYPNSYAVRESLQVLQEGFRLRSCEDSVFSGRSRPCLQYQIKRCSGPCVGKISEADYQADVQDALCFLEGKSDQLLHQLEQKMNQHSQALAFERAAQVRDQIMYLHRMREKQSVIQDAAGNFDVFVWLQESRGSCLNYLMVRQGKMLGSRTFHPDQGLQARPSEQLLEVLSQFYLANERAELPDEILVEKDFDDRELLEQALESRYGRQIAIRFQVRSQRSQWLALARTNAEEQLAMHVAKRESMASRLNALQQALGSGPIKRLECFDISHSLGEETRASCVVFGPEGPDKRQYRTFKIVNVTAGDDYAAMEQAVRRRLERLDKEQKDLPDVLVLDGGKGQMTKILQLLQDMGLQDRVALLAIAKGVTRKAGLEQLYWRDVHTLISLPAHAPALHLLQHIRDEAHRVAITDHRKARGKVRTGSLLDRIPGIGPTRRRALIQHFGSARAIKSASIEQIKQVSGIDQALATTIHQYLQDS